MLKEGKLAKDKRVAEKLQQQTRYLARKIKKLENDPMNFDKNQLEYAKKVLSEKTSIKSKHEELMNEAIAELMQEDE